MVRVYKRLFCFTVATVALPWLAFGFRSLAPVRRERAPYVVAFLKLTLSIAANEPFVFSCVDEFALSRSAFCWIWHD
jgi:hypothetical protein